MKVRLEALLEVHFDEREVRLGGLRWSERAADFLTLGGTVAAFDPSAHTAGPSALLLHEDLARKLADRHGVGIVWTVLCVKSVRLLDPAPSYPLLRISGGLQAVGDRARRLHAAGG